MTANEYRIKNPNCAYCDYNNSNLTMFKFYCRAKEKHFICNQAKRCPIYSPKSIY